MPDPAKRLYLTAASLRRVAPVMVIGAAMALVFALGLHRYLQPDVLIAQRAWLAEQVAAHKASASLLYGMAYVAVAALSIPGAAVLTIVGGLLFGWLVAGSVALVAATLGATLLFLAARSFLHDRLALRAGRFLQKFAADFRHGEASYLLFLRLVPLFPFWLVNLAPALLGARLATFIWTTLVGIAPATFAFAWFGATLGGALDARAAACASQGVAQCPYASDLISLVTPQMQIALALLGLLALAPVMIKHARRRPNG